MGRSRSRNGRGEEGTRGMGMGMGMGLLLYPAIMTWGCILRCSVTRLPMVWSSFLIRKSEQLDMPGCQC